MSDSAANEPSVLSTGYGRARAPRQEWTSPVSLNKVRSIMTADVVSVEPTSTFKEIVEILLTRGFDGVPVVDIGNRLVGMVTEADLMSRHGFPQAESPGARRRLQDDPDQRWMDKAGALTAEELMTTALVTCGPDDDLRSVARRMLRQHLKQLPVVDGDQLVGIISRRDLLAVFDRPDDELAKDVHALLAGGAWVADGSAVRASVDDGVVMVSGHVASKEEAAAIRLILAAIPGVVDVVGELVCVSSAD
jgi:CBS domain-containing protein